MAFPWEPKGEGSDAELLALVRSAIAQIVATGQSYSAGDGRTLTRADLAELRRTERELQQRVSGATEGLASNYARFKRAM